jgi:predicted transcriptional regulator
VEPTRLPDLRQIKSYRKSLGITLIQLEKCSEVKRSLLRKIEDGETSTSYEKASKIFQCLNKHIKISEQSVEKIMSPIVSLLPSDSAEKARNILITREFDAIPVLDKVGNLKGIVTVYGLNSHKLSDESKVELNTVLEDLPPTFPHDTPTSWIKNFFNEFGKCVLVTKNRKYVGIITMWDFIQR